MARRTARTYALATAVMLALGVALAGGSVALGVEGATPGEASWLPLGSSVTTSLVDPGNTTGEHYFKVQLAAGNTLRADFTNSLETSNLKAVVLPYARGYSFIEADRLSGSFTRLTFMAPVSGIYTIDVSASMAGTFTVTSANIAAVRYGFSGFSAPSKPRRNTTFGLTVKLGPDYDGPTSPVKFAVQRKVGKKWKSYRSVATRFSGGTTAYTRFSGSSKLPKGTFRVRASFSDAAHRKAIYTGWKTIKVR
jgi:hypothetical protein